MKNKRQRGEVVVEASLIVTLVMLFITIMLYIGMVLYQQTLASVMANQTAANIAQVYSNNLKDPFTGYVASDRVYQSVTYSNMKTDAYMNILEQKANVFAKYRLKSSRILGNGISSVDVDVVKKPNELLKSQIVVTIRDRYDVPLVGIFGTSGLVEFSASGRADCVDVLDYVNGVEAIGDPEDSVVPSLPESDTCLVTFVTDKVSANFHANVPVLRGKSIVTSNHYSHSTMPKNPKLNDMKFMGWATNDGHSFTASTQINENITVYGMWDCKITFKPEGGKVNPTSKYAEYMKPTSLPTPTRKGYAFEGWYTEKEGKGQRYYSDVTQITGNVTLYAKWRCTHDYKSVKIREGNCCTRSRFRYTCVRCPYSYEANGSYGGHTNGSWRVAIAATCRPGLEILPCVRCGTTLQQRGIPGSGCVHNARCGIIHDLGGDAYSMSRHGGKPAYQKSTKGECMVCIYCGSPYMDWVRRNGQIVANGMYCREHIKSGKRASDSAFSTFPVVSVH